MAAHGIRRLPLTLQSTYADLVSRLQDESLLELGGTPVLRSKGGRAYWYAVQRMGDRTIERYLGPDTEEIRAQVERARAANRDRRAREQQRRPLVRMCQEAGLPRADAQTGKVLLALSKAGVFRLRAVLVGTHAFRCYPGLLGVDFPEAHGVTEDIDVAAFRSISVALDDRADPPLTDALAHVGSFVARPGLQRQATAWRDRDRQTVVELLTPNQGPDRDEPVELPALGAFATPLRFLDYLIHRPTPAAVLYRSGVPVHVPQPQRYAVHKLIVAPRRAETASVKARKDIEQAAALIRVLAEDRPDDLEEAYHEAFDRGPAWRSALDRGTRRLPQEIRDLLRRAV